MHGRKVLTGRLTVAFFPRRGRRRRTLPIFVDRERARRDGTGGLECQLCHVRLRALASHINAVHGMTTAEYRGRYGQCRLSEIDPDAAIRAGATRFARQKNREFVCAFCGRRSERRKRVSVPKYCSLACVNAGLAKAKAGVLPPQLAPWVFRRKREA